MAGPLDENLRCRCPALLIAPKPTPKNQAAGVSLILPHPPLLPRSFAAAGEEAGAGVVWLPIRGGDVPLYKPSFPWKR